VAVDVPAAVEAEVDVLSSATVPDAEAEVPTPAAEVAGEVFADATPSAPDVADDAPRPD
jgi:hypothetical protein